MTCALCYSRKAPLLTYFFPRDKLVSADNGEAVMAQREPQKPRRVFVLPGTLFDTGFGPWTRKHDSLEMQDQAERFAFRVLIS